MRRQRVVILTAAVFLTAAFGALAAPPESAFVDGVTNEGWHPGYCFIASFGQLVQQRDPSVTPAQVVARSGLSTQAAWMRAGGGFAVLEHPRWIDSGVEMDAARLCGVTFGVGYMKGRGAAPAEAKFADEVTMYDDEAASIERLKTVIASGTPVQVHVDYYYLGAGIPHGNHRVVVHGYDADNVYYADNAGVGRENEAVSWADFLAAWRCEALFNPAYPARSHFMLYLTSDPILTSDDWTLAYLGMDALGGTKNVKTGPAAFRAAAAAIEKGADGESVLSFFERCTLANWRPYMVDYLSETGHADWATSYDVSAAACALLNAPAPDWSEATVQLRSIADAEEAVLAEMAALAASVEPIALFAPADGDNLASLGRTPFRWATLPNTGPATVQFAMTGDFGDTKNVQSFRPSGRKTSIPMTSKDWLKILKKDGGDRSLKWRVAGTGRNAALVSAERTLTWDALAMTAVSPADAYAAAPDELVAFTFEAPPLALKPRIAISPVNNFSDARRLIYLTPGRGATTASFARGTRALLLRKDDGDGIFYWRVEDAGTKLTTVEPSAARSLTLP